MSRLLCALLVVSSAYGAEFFSGQAARAVLGQPSFSAHEAGVSPISMEISDRQLFVADAGGRVITFDLSRIPAASDDFSGRNSSGCALCGFAPVAAVAQTVAPESARISVFGKSLAAIDTRTHRILVWHDVTSAAATIGPDVSLDIADPETATISESTIIDPISVAVDGSHLFVGDAFLHRVLVWKSLPQVQNQPADFVLGQRDFASTQSVNPPRADTLARPDALVSDGTNLYVGDSMDGRILVFSPAGASLSGDQVFNSGTLSGGAMAPGTLITIDTAPLVEKTVSAPDEGADPLPTTLGGVEVVFNGAALPLLSVAPTEIRAQLPYTVAGIASANLYLRVEHTDGAVITTAPVAVGLVSSSPGLFAFGGAEPRAGMLLHSTSPDSPDADTSVSADSPASPGETVTIWATGLHVVAGGSDQMPRAGVPYSGSEVAFTPVRAFVGGQPAEVASVTLPQTSIGIYQVKVILPAAMSQRGTAQLAISEDGYSSNAVTFPVRKSQP